MVVLGLVQNAAILLGLSTLYNFIKRFHSSSQLLAKVFLGILFGAVSIMGMAMPFYYTEGIIYDGRSIILSLAGLFGGTIAGGIAAIFALLYRISLGGAGVWAGIATIVLSVLAGLFYRRRCNAHPENLTILQYYLFGIAVHIIMLLCQYVLLPSGLSLIVLQSIGIPVVLVFPVATVLMGILFANEDRRVAAEVQLRESEERFRSISRNALAAILVFQEDTILYVNRQFELVTGYTAEEALQLSFFSLVHPDYREVVRQREAARRAGNDVSERYEFKIITKTREERWIDFASEQIQFAGHSATIGTALDITERKRTEEQLQLNREYLKAVLDSITDAVFVDDADTGEIIDVNQSMCEMYGMTYEEAIRTPIGNLSLGTSPYSQADALE